MDWRHNQWIGVIAAVAVVVGIVGVFIYLTRTSASRDFGGITFMCESTQQTFNVSDRELDSMDGVTKWGSLDQVDGFACKNCDKQDAVKVYWCPTCQKWYPFKRNQLTAESVRCPEGHET